MGMGPIGPILAFVAPSSPQRVSASALPAHLDLSLLSSPLFSCDAPLLESPISVQDIVFSPETLLAPINAETPAWLRSIVWTDFRLAVTFFVVSPLMLLVWSAIQCRPAPGLQYNSSNNNNKIAADAVLRVMTGYWQASSLLLITVLLNIGASPIGVVTGAVAQFMIWVSLNWWQSLNEEAASSEELLGQVFGIWRIIASWVAGVGVAVQIPFLQCAVRGSTGSAAPLVGDPFCAAWLEPPKAAATLVEVASSELLNTFAVSALTIYICYLVYYIVFPLQAVGRCGRAARLSFTFVDPLVMLGFLEEAPSEDRN